MGGVPFKPTYPEDLDFLPLGFSMYFLCTFVVDGDREDVDEPTITVRVGVIAFRRGDHDIRSCAEVDDIGASL